MCNKVNQITLLRLLYFSPRYVNINIINCCQNCVLLIVFLRLELVVTYKNRGKGDEFNLNLSLHLLGDDKLKEIPSSASFCEIFHHIFRSRTVINILPLLLIHTKPFYLLPGFSFLLKMFVASF